MNLQQKVQAVVDAACPNDGISFGRLGDKATWRVDFKEEATAQQRAAARSAIGAFDLAAHAAEEQAEAQRQAEIDAAIQQDNVIQQVKVMTNAEYDAWWAKNVTNAAQAIGVLKRVVRVLCRRVL